MRVIRWVKNVKREGAAKWRQRCTTTIIFGENLRALVVNGPGRGRHLTGYNGSAKRESPTNPEKT
jgi:hypothetical protein